MSSKEETRVLCCDSRTQCDRVTPELSVHVLCQFILSLLLCNESNPNEVPRPVPGPL